MSSLVKKTGPRTSVKALTTHPIHPLTIAGLICIGIALTITGATFWPIIWAELSYNTRRLIPVTSYRPMVPVDRDFGIVIPKIGANAHVIPNVDPYDSRAYEYALTKGVAQAKGTGLPGKPGNIFLFAHSSENFYVALQYNAVFYLLTKLTKGDEILLYYKNNRYSYRVTTTVQVPAKAIQYLSGYGAERETVTLMTCWPPGTNFERLLVIAERNP